MDETRRERTAEAFPSSASCCDIGREFLLSGDLGEALWHLRQAVQIDGDSVTAWQLLGRCFEQLGEPKRARRCYTLAFRLLVKSSSETRPGSADRLPFLWRSRSTPDA